MVKMHNCLLCKYLERQYTEWKDNKEQSHWNEEYYCSMRPYWEDYFLKKKRCEFYEQSK